MLSVALAVNETDSLSDEALIAFIRTEVDLVSPDMVDAVSALLSRFEALKLERKTLMIEKTRAGAAIRRINQIALANSND